ncbi:MAG: hypothetical protein JO185_26015 [Acidobacteriaceae bacterium]|nr:hypothetical protein [Acidobacteriaceae bacterium]
MSCGVITTPVNGSEYTDDTRIPGQALAQFYKAFNSQDLTLMQQNWEQSDEITMDNPLGGIKRGWKEIREVYERILQASLLSAWSFMTTVVMNLRTSSM